ncbi:DUF6531 domain-containing protein [Ramlibacter albus]|uniref:RHS repeat protein n=1 Tax=Ramlibacter albus TaxID=2079448 RepID=A0A923MCU6_9BURK|nr:DUF6531 domain-containing protein [Ramlibacter albus]MBC5768345.1 RHS repeat protein [Ramlibacter albus]
MGFVHKVAGAICVALLPLAAFAALQPATGDVQEIETDFADSAPNGLTFTRHYRSSANVDAGLGARWAHNWAAQVQKTDATAVVRFGDGSKLLFERINGAWKVTNRRDTLVDTTAGLLLTRSSDESRWQFDTAGKLVSVTARNGWRTELAYEAGRLTRITNAFGRSVQLSYESSGRLAGASFPDGSAVAFAFDSAGRLATSRGADGSTRQYAYGNSTWPSALTGVAQDGATRVAYRYDAHGRGAEMQMAGVPTKESISYPSAVGGDGMLVAGHVVDPALYKLSVTTTDALGNTVTKLWQGGDGQVRLVGSSNLLGGSVANTSFGEQNLPVAEYDFAGVQRTTQWDTSRSLPLAVTEAANRPEARTTQTTWHPSFRLPTLITEAGRTTALAYDSLGNVLTKTVTDTATGEARTWHWEYAVNNLPVAMTDPKGGVWRYGHDAAGNRTSVKNPLGQETTFVFDGAGRVIRQVDSYGLVTTYSRDARGRVVAQTRGSESTTYSYTPSGLLAGATLPTGYVVSYSYDAAQRLVGVTDNRGSAVAYTLDAAGNRVREEVKDAAGNIALATRRVINALGQLAGVQGAAGQTTQLGYDANGELVAQTDPLNQTTRTTLDALRRTTATTFPDNASVAQAWTPLDQLTQVVDPKNVKTTYTVNAFGETMSESSPDIGTMTYKRDANGDVVETKDAKGQVTAITRDALGRPTSIRYHAGNTTTLAYDAAGFLSRIEDSSGSTTYTRDLEGNVLTKTVVINDNPSSPSRFTVTYTYTHGELTSIRYGSGLVVTYRRSLGQISGIDVLEPGKNKAALAFVNNLVHTPLGAPKSWTWSNGDAASRSFDADGRMVSNEFARYSYDVAGRMTGIAQDLWASRTIVSGTTTTTELYKAPITWTAAYDNRDRLVSFARDGAKSVYTLDANSNRLTAIETQGSDVDLQGTFDQPNLAEAANQTLKMDPGSNRLLGFTQTITRTQNGQPVSTTSSTVNYSVDENGAMTSDGLRTFVYDDMGRLAKVKVMKDGEAASVRYLHSALGQRVFKSEPEVEQTLPNEVELGNSFTNWLRKNFGWLFAQGKGKASLGQAFVYGDGEIPSWALLGEYDNGTSGSKGTGEFIWLPTRDGLATLVGMYRNGKLYAIHTDHIGTPRLITDAAKQPVWQTPYSAFLNNEPSDVLSTTANQVGIPRISWTKPGIELNISGLGRYRDKESGLVDNYRRTLLGAGDRYTQPDPIGKAGGANEFIYVNASPLDRTDPMGLFDPTGFITRAGTRAGATLLLGGGPANPVADAAATLVLVGSLGYEIYQACKDVSDENPCRDQPSRTDAFLRAAQYAGVGPEWTPVGWDQFNKPKTKDDQLKYKELRQRAGNDPYGHRSPEGGEIVEHPADKDHPCPHFHAKKNLADPGIVIAYDPKKP